VAVENDMESFDGAVPGCQNFACVEPAELAMRCHPRNLFLWNGCQNAVAAQSL
jgi:hypothetical protein